VRARGAQVGTLEMPEWAGVLEDVDARRKAQADIAWLAQHDPLTGLANRAVFHERLDLAIEQAARGVKSAVLCLDLDRFKEVNDSLGHPVGDALLKQVAARLLEQVRHADTLARLGGDEFAILISGNDPAEEARILAERLITAISLPYEVSHHNVVIGLSLGISLVEDHRCGRDRLIQNADLALYKAKEQGRGCFRFFEPVMDAHMQQRRTLEMDLRRGLEEGQFRIHYQPLVDLASARLNGFEALLRWEHPTRGLLQPDSFLPLAGEIGLINRLGQWVLEQACVEAAGWPPSLKVAVNLAAAQLTAELHLMVERALEHAKLPARRLELEVTENALYSHIEAATPSLLRLKARGVSIVMDDFGTGYSSLGYLRAFPFDKVKIDKSYVRDLDKDSHAGAVINAVSLLCSQLGITTTIEGVETRLQLQLINTHAGGEGQGFLFGHPCSADEVAAVIDSFCIKA
jgi:diguanylate cyclase (GGDEF)-like protein